ncbi:MAG: hypothetical protein ACKORA_02785, partial [Solirubrobacterales bacterium]
MKLATYSSEGATRAGVFYGDALFDAWELLGDGERTSLRELIALDRVGELGRLLAGDHGGSPVEGSWTLGPPIPDPDKVICIGLNYRAHAEEFELDIPEAPTVFMGFEGDGPRLELTFNLGRKEPYEIGTGYGHVAIT